jgi:hypothetical protein
MLLLGLRAESRLRPDLLDTVEPGTLHTLTDLSDGERALIVMGCPPDNSGGTIWRAFDNTAVDYDGLFLIPGHLVDERNVVRHLSPGEYYERSIVTITGAAAYLAVQHVAELAVFPPPGWA